MSALRTAAVVMFAIAAVDAAIDGIEALADMIPGTEGVNLWPVLLWTGAAVIILDLIVDRRTFIGRICYDIMEWLAAKVRGMLAFTRATTIGSGAVVEEPTHSADTTPADQETGPADQSTSPAPGHEEQESQERPQNQQP